MQGPNGYIISSFKDLVRVGVNDFIGLFKEDSRAIIVEVVKMETFFCRFIFKDDNVSLIEAISKEDLQ
jgi:hypothetical protein